MSTGVVQLRYDEWEADFGGSLMADDERHPTAQVDAEAEVPQEEWRGIVPDATTNVPEVACFVDGVRRIEARVWMTYAGGNTELGICASYASGVVQCDRRAEIARTVVRRAYFGRSGVPDIRTPHGIYAARPVAEPDTQTLVKAPQEEMRALEAGIAREHLKDSGASASRICVLDGSLRGGDRTPGVLGYIKTHHVHYLEDRLREIAGALKPGERTPVFLIQTGWTRFSWYLHVGKEVGFPWAGVVRCEAWTTGGVDAARSFADASAKLLPRYASEPHREARAPQNLYPIAGLEHQLRHRLGNLEVVKRNLRIAAGAFRGAVEPEPGP